MPSPITRPSLHDHGADDRVRAGLPAGPAGELDRPHQMLHVAFRRGGSGHPENTVTCAHVFARPGWALTNVRPRAPSAPDRARADSRRRLRAARVEHRLRAAVRLFDRRGVALHLARRRDVLAGPGPGLLPEPRHLHLPRLRAPAGDVRAARLRCSASRSGTSPTSSTRTRPRSGSRPGCWPRRCAWAAWRPPTGPPGGCGESARASWRPPCSRSRSCRWRTRASRSRTWER